MSYSGYDAAMEEAYREQAREAQKEANRVAAEQQRKLNELAKQREAAVARQREELKTLVAQQSAAMTAQQERVAGLRIEQQAKVADLKQQSATQLRNLNATNDAVTNSLRVLSEGPRGPGPAAQQTRRNQQTSRARTTTTGLRIGSQPRSAGANLSI